MVTRFYGIKTGVRKVAVPNIIGISKTQARINLSNISLTYLEQTTAGTSLADNDIVSAQNTSSGTIIPMGSIVQYTYKVFTFTPPHFPPFFPPFFPPHFPPFFPPFFPPHFPPFFPPYFPPVGCTIGAICEPGRDLGICGTCGPWDNCYRNYCYNTQCNCAAPCGIVFC